ncbi:MAG: RimK family alpha-L-glutamate ligase [Burkholderiaceae bacterium]|nr:RimK family alpha-L-glutamate ligase [Burkholderiaceae bacterium]
MRQAFSGIDLRPFGARLVERAKAYPTDANTLMDLSTVLQLTGNRELGLATQAQALKLQQHYRLATAVKPATIRLLAILAGGDLMANTPVEFLVEGGDVALDLLYVDADLPLPARLPEHDAIFVAIGESDHNRPLLKQIEERARGWTCPVVNAPQRIAQLTRNGACALLHDAPGINMPLSVRLARTLLEQVAAGQMALSSLLPGGEFPIIARPVGSHAGHDLDKIEDVTGLAAYLAATPPAEFYISRFVDYRGADGLFRKYRIMLIDGRPYVCHMAISEHWMIHYLNAGMAESAAKRAEEARFMATFDMGFALRHARAFQAVNEILQLDYVGLDCAESRDGDLLIFEADSDMIVHNMDPVDMYPYKAPAMRKIFDAFHAMLVERIAREAQARGK